MDKSKIKQQLLARQKEIESDLDSLEQDDVLESDSWQTVDEIGDEARENLEKLTKMEKNDLYRKSLSLVEKALVDLEQDRYGICNKCENLIGEERLAHFPEVQYCIECQKEIEAK